MKFAPIKKTKQTLRDGLHVVGEFIGSSLQFGIPGIGSVISFAVGKWVAGLILALICGAVLFRLLWRRKHADHTRQQLALPFWKKALAFTGALLGAAILVEATDLPVRFSQPGFSMGYWLLVVVAVGWLNAWMRGWLRPKSAPSSDLSTEVKR